MGIRVADYIVDFLIKKGISDVFGYPGGMVTHLMDAFRIRSNEITAHVNYHEQGAAFAACGYAQVSGKPGVAYATSGPGATNLITGICNAYFDSIPCIFITGQVNTFESKGDLPIRQKGFQETDIISMVKGVTKYSVYVENAESIKYYLERAYFEAMDGRKGPVLLDIPMNIFKTEIDESQLKGFASKNMKSEDCGKFGEEIKRLLNESKRPCILLGNGIKLDGAEGLARQLANLRQIPFVTSMVAFDCLSDSDMNYGFIGAYGNRTANFIVAKADLLICIGTRLDVRQVGAQRYKFAPNAKIVRVDVDAGELRNQIRPDELQYRLAASEALSELLKMNLTSKFAAWVCVCNEIRETLAAFNYSSAENLLVQKMSETFREDSIITTDVGQNQVWIAQSMHVKRNQKVLFSGGHGAMGFSLPASIGAYYGSGYKTIYSINGDGGFQMNIQELQFIARECIPIKIAVINNHALGMIRHFQEMYFSKKYFQTNLNGGYSVPSFTEIANSYGIRSKLIRDVNEIDDTMWGDYSEPTLVEFVIDQDTYVFPKLEFGKPNQDQEPLIDREVYTRLMEL